MHVHTNGLQLSVSETYRVTTTPAGFVLEPPGNNNRRDRFTVAVLLVTSPPLVKGYRTRSLNGRDLRYTATHSEEGGSSGFEWDVEAFERVGDHWIVYREHKLTEREPKELWEIAGGARFVPPK